MDDFDHSISRRAEANSEDVELVDTEARRRRLIARLVGLRKSNGLTQAAVAELMSVGQSVIAEIESGRTDVRVSTLERYARAVSRGQLQLDLGRDAWTGRRVGGVAEAPAPYGLTVDESDFWTAPSLDDLVAEQRTGPITDPQGFVLAGVSEHDWDEFFVAMGLAE
jgi:transcriptional regulator with XRE-family HTH domain